jgi:hypothetical protein
VLAELGPLGDGEVLLGQGQDVALLLVEVLEQGLVVAVPPCNRVTRAGSSLP